MNEHQDPSEKLRTAGIIKSKKKQEESVETVYSHYDFEETDYPDRLSDPMDLCDVSRRRLSLAMPALRRQYLTI